MSNQPRQPYLWHMSIWKVVKELNLKLNTKLSNKRTLKTIQISRFFYYFPEMISANEVNLLTLSWISCLSNSHMVVPPVNFKRYLWLEGLNIKSLSWNWKFKIVQVMLNDKIGSKAFLNIVWTIMWISWPCYVYSTTQHQNLDEHFHI